RPVLAAREDGVRQVVPRGEPVEHRRDLGGLLVQGGAGHAPMLPRPRADGRAPGATAGGADRTRRAHRRARLTLDAMTAEPSATAGQPQPRPSIVVRTTPIPDLPGGLDALVDLLPDARPHAWVRRGDGIVGWGEAL